MTDRSKFEEMLEHLINEDHESAKELFHQLVVEKSREIYEDILAEDFGAFNEMDDEEEEADENEIGGDETDDFIDDVENDDSEEGNFGDEDDSSEEELEDRVVDLEDALDELRAEFESLMSDEDEMGSEEGEGEGDDDFNWGDEGSEESDDEFPAKENFMREYIEKVAAPKHGDNGANTKSPVAKPNHMGGSSANIVKGGVSTTGGTKGGLLAPTPKEDDMGNVNVPGGNAGKTAFKTKEAGHGAEKKGSADTASNKKSVLGSR